MENNKVRRLNNGFKILAWMYMFCALLALVVIRHTVNTVEVTINNHIWSNVTIVVDSVRWDKIMNFYDIPNGQVTGDIANKYAHRM